MSLLRSIIPSTSSGDDTNLMYQNYLALRESIFKFDIPSEVNIYEYIREFTQRHGHLPNLKSIHDHFEQGQNFDEADRIQQISTKSVSYRGDFISLIEKTVEEARVMSLASALSDAKTIARSGLEVKDGRIKKLLKGARDASNHLLTQISKINTPTFGSRIGGDAMVDEEDFWEEFEKAKHRELDVRPITGHSVIDNALGGFKKKELYILAAYTGHLKSTTSLNWAYNQAIYGGTSTLYFSLEMHYPQCRRMIYVYHSMHPKFRAKRIALGLQAGQTDACIDPKKIREGTLSEDEVEFLKEVTKDLHDGVKEGKYGSLRFEVADPNVMDTTVEDIRTRAEAIAQSEPFKMLVVDHALLVSSRRWVASTTERLNEVIRDLKKMSLGFNRGEGIPVLCLFQISREGFKAAEKNGGKYNLTHLSYANEAERSADVVICSWFGDDQREKSQVLYQCLKSRDQAPFENFEAQINWPAGRTLDMPLQFQSSARPKQAPKGDALDKILDGELQ